MKHRLLYIAMILCLIGNAYGAESAESDKRVSIRTESMENGSASTLGMYTDGIFYAGFSLNHIASSEVIQHSNRKTIYPIYLVIGFRAPWKISPYIEGGLDLPEAIIDEIFDDEDNSIDQTDYFFSAGLEFSLTDMFSLSLYAKKYRFKFREDSLARTTKISPKSYGIGVTLHF